MIHSSKEWANTEQGERMAIMRIKGIALCASWDAMKTIKTKKDRALKFPEMMEIIKEKLEQEKVKCSDDGIITEFLINVYQDADRFRMLKYIDENATSDEDCKRTEGYYLRFIAENEVCNAVIKYILSRKSISSVKYVQALIYHTHLAFYHIGREYKWGKRQDIRVQEGRFETYLMNGGNPLSKSSLKTIKERFAKEIKPDRLPKFQIEDKNGEKQEWNKHSKPGSIAVVFHVMTTIFANILKGIRPNNGVKSMNPIENWVNVLMLYYFLIHEGARPGDTIGWKTGGTMPENAIPDERGQQHEDLMFSFNGRTFYVLVLAFVKPSTLAYFLGEGQLKRYVCWFYKGKCAGKKQSGQSGEYRGRVKSWMPPAYNMLDLATMYIILMRIKLVIAPENVGIHIFKKGQNVSHHLKQNTTPLPEHRRKKQGYFSVNVEGLTAYSIRYAAAEEERKFNIREKWIGYRMGHSHVSEMFKWYSDNKDQRMSFIGDFLNEEKYTVKLGSEINEPLDITNPANIPLLTVKQTDRNALPVNPVDVNLSPEIMEELTTLSDILEPFVLGNETFENIPELKRYIPNRQELQDDLSAIPLGMHFKFSEKLLSKETMNQLNERLEYISGCFATVEVPEIPQQVWAYPQVMWGEWNPELKYDVVTSLGNQMTREIAELSGKLYEECREKDLSDEDDSDEEVEDNSDEEVEDNSDEEVEDDSDEEVEDNSDEEVEDDSEEEVEDNSDEEVEDDSEEEVEDDSEDSDAIEYKQSGLINGNAPADKRPRIDYDNVSWKGRMIAVIVNIPGCNPSYEYRIPGTDHYVWIGRVKSFEKIFTHQFKVNAVWYKGDGAKHPKGDMKPANVDEVKSPSEGLIHWWRASKTHETTFRVPHEDLSKMKEHLERYWKKE